mmetsp:Transcript_48211/g.96142  ORF Transcript_48211/g.96142 Transcript_48211/m.96142 type:complete len:214 (-) Transcript_48211:112-753(-)
MPSSAPTRTQATRSSRLESFDGRFAPTVKQWMLSPHPATRAASTCYGTTLHAAHAGSATPTQLCVRSNSVITRKRTPSASVRWNANRKTQTSSRCSSGTARLCSGWSAARRQRRSSSAPQRRILPTEPCEKNLSARRKRRPRLPRRQTNASSSLSISASTASPASAQRRRSACNKPSTQASRLWSTRRTTRPSPTSSPSLALRSPRRPIGDRA